MGEIEKAQKWDIGKHLSLQPVFETTLATDMTQKEVECKKVLLVADGHDYIVDFQAFFMFCYFVANEELRQQLALKYERKINYIPYEVTIKLDDEEALRKVVKRRIELPVDEISMAYAKNEGWKMFLQQKFGNMNYEKAFNELTKKRPLGR